MVCSARRCADHYKEIDIEEFDIRYTQKQIDKYNRQKYITELEKISKNLFKMFRDKEMTASAFIEKFKNLKNKLSTIEAVSLDYGYYKELEAHINRLYDQVLSIENFGEKEFDTIREAEMSNLNRLQKLKNSSSYKKQKHKNSSETWE